MEKNKSELSTIKNSLKKSEATIEKLNDSLKELKVQYKYQWFSLVM